MRLPLATIRKGHGKSQVELAEASGLDQAVISRLENRDDALVSSLRRYAGGLGGKLEVTIILEGKRYIVEM